MIFLPVIGALLQSFISVNHLARWTSLGASLLSSIVGLAAIASMKKNFPGLQLNETFTWIGSYDIRYDMGLDGVSALLVLLISIVFPVILISEWNSKSKTRGMLGLFLVLQSSLLGLVCSQDLFLLFFFFSLTLLPFYFLFSLWGGEEREKSAFRFIITSSTGNALVFFALILVYFSANPHTFSLRELASGKLEGSMIEVFGSEISVSKLAFLFFSVGLGLRIPIWPFHGWFTYLSTQASASVLVALLGVFTPVVLYLFLRISFLLFPLEIYHYSTAIVILGVVNALLGALLAVTQKELRLFLAFIGLSQFGFILMGLGSLDLSGMVGAVYQTLTVGLSLAGFGLFSGLLRDRTGFTDFLQSNEKAKYGGIAKTAPILAISIGLLTSSILGFPGFGGFIGQSLVMMGGFTVHPLAVVGIGLGLLIITYGFFGVYRLIFLGKPSSELKDVADLSSRERGYLFPIIGVLFILGVYPEPLLNLVRPSVASLLELIK